MSLRVLFESFPQTLLEENRSVVYALDAGLRLLYANPAWARFASENGENPEALNRRFMGQPIHNVIPHALRDFYAAVYARVIERNEQLQHTYECSSPSRFRLMHMRLFPLKERGGILCVNSEVAEGAHIRTPGPPNEGRYREDGLINMCSHCRRTRRAAKEDWDWVPNYVESPPPMISFGLCPICREYHAHAGLRTPDALSQD
jgi:hypothetical protein